MTKETGEEVGRSRMRVRAGSITMQSYINNKYRFKSITMVANSKLQEVEVTARWHNIWLGSTLFFFVTTALFAGLFGGFYSAWQDLHECTNLKLLNDGLYDESRRSTTAVTHTSGSS